MSRLIPRRIKKACKYATLIYRGYVLIDIKFRYVRNTKWKRKAISLAAKEENRKHQYFDDEIWRIYQEEVKKI